MFKIGDRVKVIDTFHAGYWPNGTEFVIEDIILNLDTRSTHLKGLSYNGILGTIHINRCELVTSNIEILFKNVNVKEENKPCTCDSMDLFRKGCTCGAVNKRQWGLAAQK